jgi:hypothetical protein
LGSGAQEEFFSVIPSIRMYDIGEMVPTSIPRDRMALGFVAGAAMMTA